MCTCHEKTIPSVYKGQKFIEIFSNEPGETMKKNHCTRPIIEYNINIIVTTLNIAISHQSVWVFYNRFQIKQIQYTYMFNKTLFTNLYIL